MMQKRQYIYYRDRNGDTCHGQILRFSKSLQRAQIEYEPFEAEPGTKRIAWVLLSNIEPQTREGEVVLPDGTEYWVEADCVEYDGENVYRFEAPCTCYPNGNATMAAMGRVIVGGESSCPVHGYGE